MQKGVLADLTRAVTIHGEKLYADGRGGQCPYEIDARDIDDLARVGIELNVLQAYLFHPVTVTDEPDPND